MKTKTATADILGASLQARIVVLSARLARKGVTALALTAVGLGLFGASSALADGPQRPGQAVNSQNAQITRVQTPGNTNFGKLNTIRVSRVEAGSTGTGPNDQKACEQAAADANSLLEKSAIEAKLGAYDTSFAYAKAADNILEEAQDNGCFVVY
jgi:hypothetical protein